MMKSLLAAIAVFVAGSLFSEIASAAVLKGTFEGTGDTSCLSAPGGFDSVFRPNHPDESWTISESNLLTITFKKNGTGTFETRGETVAGPPTPGFNPGASSFSSSGSFTYQLKKGEITLTIGSVNGETLSGPNKGQNFSITGYVLKGFVVPGGVSLASVDPPMVETITTFPGGGTNFRICHRTRTFLSTTVPSPGS